MVANKFMQADQIRYPEIINSTFAKSAGDEVVKTTPSPALQSILDEIKPNSKNAKNKTFYLDEDIIKAIKQAAAKTHVSESKLVNDLLRHILINL